MCPKGKHSLIRVWRNAKWQLACCLCAYLIEDHPKALKKESQ